MGGSHSLFIPSAPAYSRSGKLARFPLPRKQDHRSSQASSIHTRSAILKGLELYTVAVQGVGLLQYRPLYTTACSRPDRRGEGGEGGEGGSRFESLSRKTIDHPYPRERNIVSFKVRLQVLHLGPAQ